MSLLSRVESVFEAVAEGGFRRLFSPRLQPIEVARVLEREMVNGKVVGTASIDVPNRFIARLHPTDYERFSSLGGTVERDVAAYLDRRADEEGLRPLGRIQVELQSDEKVARSMMKAESSIDAVPSSSDGGRLDRTSVLPAVAPTRLSRTLVMTAEDGQELRVGAQPVRIGRGVDNDLVVPDVRVSRHHAAVEPSGDGWVVRDMNSTNGTYVDGGRINAVLVNAEAELSLGGYRVKLRPG